MTTICKWWAAAVVVAVCFALTLAAPAPAQAVPSPDAPPTTTTTSPPLAPVEAIGEESSPGMFDVSGRVQKAMNDWFSSLVSSAIAPALQLLGRVLLSAPDLTDQAEVRAVWMISLGVADALMVVFALVGGIVVMSHETVQTRYRLKEIAPRLVLAIITANVSLVIISQAIVLANALAQGMLGGINAEDAVNGLGLTILNSASGGIFLLLLALVATVMTIVLVCIGLIRALLVVMLIVSAPLALACHALPQTDQMASLWWRALAACLSIQIAQALVLVTAIRVLFAANGSMILGLGGASGLVDLLILLCVFWVMLKIPAWAEQLVFSRGGGPVNALQQKAWTAAKVAVVAA